MTNSILTASVETELWFQTNGAKMMLDLGVKSGDSALDFGCGPGRYVVPLSQVVGPTGRIFAIERDDEPIVALREKLAASATLSVVEVFQTDAPQIPPAIAANTVDSSFLFDVLQYVNDWNVLFVALSRALKPGGRIHIYPAALPHPGAVDITYAVQKLESLGFTYAGARVFRMMHNVDFVDDTVHTFRWK